MTIKVFGNDIEPDQRVETLKEGETRKIEMIVHPKKAGPTASQDDSVN